LQREIVRLSREHPRYGYRRICALMRRAGEVVNPKRVARVRRAEGLQARKKQRKTRRTSPSEARRQSAERPGHVWSWDFVHDQVDGGSRLKIMTVIDEFSKECLAIYAAYRIKAQDVIREVARVIEREGAPEHIRSDNGSELIAQDVRDWLESEKVGPIYIAPGAPWENGYVESFHDKLRDECMNREVFGNLAEARVILETWRCEYNFERPQSSLAYATPAEFRKLCRERKSRRVKDFAPSSGGGGGRRPPGGAEPLRGEDRNQPQHPPSAS